MARKNFNSGAQFFLPRLISEPLDETTVSLRDPLIYYVSFSDDLKDDSHQTLFFLGGFFLRHFKPKMDGESESDAGGDCGVRTWSFTDSFNSRFTTLAAYRAVETIAAVSHVAAAAIIANHFGVIAT